MPCYQANLMSVSIEATDRNILEQVLTDMRLIFTRNGQSFLITVGVDTIYITENEATLPERCQSLLNAIKQAYSREVVAEAALKYNWVLVEEEQETIVLHRY
jgi:hypothetical protein